MIKHKSQQLYDLLREELRRGVWPCDQKLPSLKELAKQYGVSVNVVNKTIEMLKASDLVRAKSGDGIYSQTSGQEEAMTFRCSEKRIFGNYPCAKHLKVLVEDYEDWQLVFWNDFFKEFVAENSDIELQINYNTTQGSDGFDVGIGSVEFLSRNGFLPETLYPSAVFREFYPSVYDGASLCPEDLVYKKQCSYFPYGVVRHYFLGNVHVPEPAAGETVLDYLERLYGFSHGKSRCWLFTGLHFLSEAGLDFMDSDSGLLRPPPREQMLEVFRRARNLYRQGALIWEHGVYPDYESRFNTALSHPFQLLELPGNSKSCNVGKNKLAERGLKLFTMSETQPQYIYPLVLGIARKCIFPEEVLRILVGLLAEKTQRMMENIGIGDGIRTGRMSPDLALHPLMAPELQYLDYFRYFISWEFFYYLNGRRGDEVYDFICAKLKYCQRNPALPAD